MNLKSPSPSPRRFGSKQISLLICAVAIALLVVAILAALQPPPEKPAEKFVPTLIGPGLGG